jgi:hypothetical protein
MAESAHPKAAKAMSTLAKTADRAPDRSHHAAIRTLALAAQSVMTASPKGAADAESRMTPSGQPAELAFLWPRPDYRISLDPCPGAAPGQRLAHCAEATLSLLSTAQAATLDRITGWQAIYGARFGAWLGLRLRQGRVAYKLYLDIPAGAPWADWEEELAGTAQVRSSRNAIATMVGLDPETGGTEVYFSAGRLHPDDICALASRIGIEAPGTVVPSLVQDLTGRSIRFALPSFDMGFSNSWAEDRTARAFTWYSTAVGLLGPDQRARSALLRVGAKRGWDMSAYSALTTGSPPRHVLIGAALTASAPPAFTATIATTPEVLLRWTSCPGGAA